MEDLTVLVQKILTHQASDEQLSEYLHWYNTLSPSQQQFPEGESIKEAAILARIQSAIAKNKRRRIRRSFVSAAASLLIIIGLSTYFFLVSGPSSLKTEPLQTAVGADIAPGGNHAVLTLSDGQQLGLDKVSAGKITEQNGSEIAKRENGLLAYSATTGSSKMPVTQYNTLTTPRGGQYQLLLSDGTKVWLNAASSIRYPTAFSGKTRTVSVTGEVYFEVAHNAAMPFDVTANRMHIEVLGTHFNVNAYADDGITRTTLLQGAIKVIHGHDSQVIKPGQQAAIAPSLEGIRVKSVNADDMIAWTKGFLQLEGNNVQAFMTQLSRWYNVDIEYRGAVPKKILGGFIGRNNNLSDVLSALEASGIHTKLEGRKIIVSSN